MTIRRKPLRSGSRLRHAAPAAGESPEEKGRTDRRRIRSAPLVPAERRGPLGRPRRGRSTIESIDPAPRLFTATIVFSDGAVMIQAFHASVATHPMQVVQRLRQRFGEDVLPIAEVRVGFHPSTPLAIALVPVAVADMIRLTEARCTSPAARTFMVDIEHRIEI